MRRLTPLLVLALVAACDDTDDPSPTTGDPDAVAADGATPGSDAARADAETPDGASPDAAGAPSPDASDPDGAREQDTSDPDAADEAEPDAADPDTAEDTDAAEDPDAPADADAAVEADPDGALPDAAPEPELCPPQPPFGTSLGDRVPDVELTDCDGNAHRLHDLCAARFAWIFEFAAWCPPCQRFATDVERIYQRFAGDGLEAWFVLSENADGSAPGPADCRAARDRFGLTMTVLIDPEGRLQRALNIASNEENLILERGGTLVWDGHYQAAQVEGQLANRFAEE